MSLEPTIELVSPKKLIGVGEQMSLSDDATPRLWQTLMPRHREIRNRVSSDLISMRVYGRPGMTVDRMSAPETCFEKWAAVEVSDHDAVPDGMRAYSLGGGLYANFVHQGPASRFADTMRSIFGTWLPASAYRLDDREYFEVLGEDWNPLDEQGRESIFIPIAE